VNITAFAKIMKKYDKVTGWHLAPIYMKEVESSYFVVSKKVIEYAGVPIRIRENCCAAFSQRLRVQMKYFSEIERIVSLLIDHADSQAVN